MSRNAHVQPLPHAGLPALIARSLAIVLMAIAFSVLPGTVPVAFAAPLEDCDADGFDDATGVPVPWPGYDETHGDTPAGPGTAQWWIQQNQGSSGGGGTSPGGTTSPGSDSGETGSGTKTPSSGTGGTSGGAKNPSRSGTSGTSAGSGGGTQTDSQATGAPAASTSTASVTSTAAAVQSVSADVAALSTADSGTALATTGDSSIGGRVVDDIGLWGALSAGFQGDNKELPLGLGLLGSLAAAGVVALGVSAIRDRSFARCDPALRDS